MKTKQKTPIPFKVREHGFSKSRTANWNCDINVINDLMFFIFERENIRIQKDELKQSAPWTKDPILGKHRFTQVDRRLDAGTVYLLENVIHPLSRLLKNASKERLNDLRKSMIEAITIYRLFNRIPTWEEIMNHRGSGLEHILFREWLNEKFRKEITEKFENMNQAGFPIFTGAHLVYAGPSEKHGRGGRSMVRYYWEIIIPGVLSRVNEILTVANKTNSVEKVFDEFKSCQGLGPFISFQIVSDLVYTPLLISAKDRNTFAAYGPGSLRFLKLAFPKSSPRDNRELSLFLLGQVNEKMTPIGRELDLSDIEHCFCETAKYIALRDGKSRARVYPFGVEK